MKNILLFPGAFNPPHHGHIKTVKIALEKVSFDELWIMPSGKRDDKTISISYEDRRELGNLFVAYLQSQLSIPVKLITAELDNIYGRFTHEILKEVKAQAGMNIIQLIGLDGFLGIQDKLDKNEKFLVINRPGYEFPEDFSHNSDVMVISDGETLPISSTQIRDMIQNSDDAYRKLVPDTIIGYIENKNLYR